MIRIALVDDEEKHRRALEKHLAEYFREHEEPYQCTWLPDATDLLEDYRFSYDIIFMDIDMKYSNGMKAAQKLRKIDPRVILIFETQLAQYAVDGYLVDAVGYLVKPISYYALSLVMSKAMAALEQQRKTLKIVVLEDENRIVIDSGEIYYIEVQDHMLIYHTVRGRSWDWTPLNQREKELAPYMFFRCHRCFLINLQRVTGINMSADEVLLGDVHLPVSRGKKSALMDALMKLYTMKEGM